MTDQKEVAEDGSVPFDELEEITGRISLFDLNTTNDMTDGELSDVLSAFEADLQELNRVLRGAVKEEREDVRVECEKAIKEVEALTGAISERVEGNG